MQVKVSGLYGNISVLVGAIIRRGQPLPAELFLKLPNMIYITYYFARELAL